MKALVAAIVLGLAVVSPAVAFDCTVANKPATAGAVGVVDITTGDFTPLKPNPGTDNHIHGGFLILAGGPISTPTATFVHAPQGVLPPVRNGVQANCDGKGLDALDVCFGL